MHHFLSGALPSGESHYSNCRPWWLPLSGSSSSWQCGCVILGECDGTCVCVCVCWVHCSQAQSLKDMNLLHRLSIHTRYSASHRGLLDLLLRLLIHQVGFLIFNTSLDLVFTVFYCSVAQCWLEIIMPLKLLWCRLWKLCLFVRIVSISELHALVPGAWTMLGKWLTDWVCSFCPLASSAMEAAKETEFGTKVA